MVGGGFGEALVQIEGPERFLAYEKLSCIFPHAFSLNSFIDDIWRKFDIHVIYERIDVLINQGQIVLGVLSCEVYVFENLLCAHTHLAMF